MPSYRSIYYSDMLIFVALAVPGVNSFLLVILAGENSVLIDQAASALALGLCGIAGVLGMAFSYFRIVTPESRIKVVVSLWVKILAAAWLVSMAISVSSLFFLVAFADAVCAVVFLLTLYKN